MSQEVSSSIFSSEKSINTFVNSLSIPILEINKSTASFNKEVASISTSKLSGNPKSYAKFLIILCVKLSIVVIENAE